jgi:hypothetical protein
VDTSGHCPNDQDFIAHVADLLDIGFADAMKANNPPEPEDLRAPEGAFGAQHDDTPASIDATRRHLKSESYRPDSVRILLVTDAPPATVERYFYFTDVTEHDSLLRYLAKGMFGVTPTRRSKAEVLCHADEALQRSHQ